MIHGARAHTQILMNNALLLIATLYRQDVMAITVYIVIIVDAGALDALLPTKKEHLLGGAGH